MAPNTGRTISKPHKVIAENAPAVRIVGVFISSLGAGGIVNKKHLLRTN
jgi:hypothetical protein